jgi:hypothetical protein
MQALKRLDDQARRLERTAEGPSFESFVVTECAASPLLDGRSILGWENELTRPKGSVTIENLKVTNTAVTVGVLGASVNQKPSATPQFSQARPGW